MNDQTKARRHLLGRWLWVLVVPLLLIGVPYGRALIESHAALVEGDACFDTDPEAAIVSYRHSVEWYAPLNPHSRAAVERLLEIGADAARSEDEHTLALRAYENLRAGILLTRWLVTPYSDTIDEIEVHIARFRALEASTGDPSALDAESAHQLQLLRSSRARAPNTAWSLISTGAFVAWIALTWIAVRGTRANNGRSRRAFRLRAIFASIAALGVWIVGLTLV